jgi:thiamine-phosphate pyrophosphorylase
MQASAYDAIDELSRIAARMHADSGAAANLPALFALTDPDRTPDVVAYAKGLPDGAGLILRHFGQPRARMASMDLASIASAKKLIYLIGADPDLAAVVGAKGVHWPERMPKEASSYKRHQPARLNAVILGPVFTSKSPSAGTPLGVKRFADLVASVDLPVYAMGGVTADNARELADTGACGIAGIGVFAR